jgi:ornithine cyclodeaminase/alanine dehydrogenase-like protein (mu-crystallin family)
VLFPIKKVMAYDVTERSAKAFASDIESELGLEVEIVAEPRQAVSGCDLIVTAGPILRQPHKTIQAGWWDEGAFASLVDFDSYWHPEAMREADKFYTDDLAQLEHYRSVGYFQDIPPVTGDLGQLVTGQTPARLSAAERTIACNLGLAMDDMAVAPTLYRRAVELSLGKWLTL